MESAGELPGLAPSLADPVGASVGGSLGGSLAVSLVSLGLVCLLAYVCLRLLSRRGVGRAAGPIKVLARCPLEARRSVYLIEAGGRCFLVGVGDGPMTTLAEVPRPQPEALATAPSGTGFAEVLGRVLRRGSGAGPT